MASMDGALVQTMQADAVAALVLGRLETAGIGAILLKGSTFADLYPDAVRSYVDADLLVDPARFTDVSDHLCALGFEELLPGLRSEEATTHATTWVHDRLPSVDLHHMVWGVGVDDLSAWRVLAARVELHVVGGHECRRLDAAGRALHLALHAAQSGTGRSKPIEDLRRGIEHLDGAVWAEASSLAESLAATAPFAAGLAMLPDGRSLALALGVSGEASSLEVLLRVENAPRGSISLARLADRSTLYAKLRYALSRAFPSPSLLRFTEPVAARGGVWLVIGYGTRVWHIVRLLPGAVAAFRRARRRQTDERAGDDS